MSKSDAATSKWLRYRASEVPRITCALLRSGGNVCVAAEELDMTPRNLRKRMHHLGMVSVLREIRQLAARAA